MMENPRSPITENIEQLFSKIHGIYSELKQVTYLSGQLVKKAEYFYDALSRRVRKHVIEYSSGLVAKETTRNFGYDGSNLILEYDGNNQLLARYTYTLGTDDVLSADITDAGKNAGLAHARDSFFYLKDAVGSVIDVQNSSGTRVQHYTYSSFGKIAAVQSFIGGVTQPLSTAFTFTGREFDAETNNYYYRARYYDPNLGRFLQKDPHPGILNSPITAVNGYAYAGNNSITNTDPTGMSFLGIDWGDVWNGIKGAIAGAVLGGVVGEAIGAWAGFTKQISEATINKILVIEGIAMASAFTGGAAGGAVGSAGGGTFLGSLAGAAAGGLTGGVIGGLNSDLLGMSGFNEGFWFGFKIGAMVGGIAGGIAASMTSSATQLAQYNGMCLIGAGIQTAVVGGAAVLLAPLTATVGAAAVAGGAMTFGSGFLFGVQCHVPGTSWWSLTAQNIERTKKEPFELPRKEKKSNFSQICEFIFTDERESILRKELKYAA